MKTLCEKRTEAGFASQTDFAEHLGTSRSAVAKWETGRAFPPARMIVKIALAIKCSEGEVIEAISKAKETSA